MRKITIAATLCTLLLACGKIGTSDRFSQAWEVIEQRPDSARVLLADMEVPSLSEGERDGVWGWIKGLSHEPNWAIL